ncbi:MAG: hypothetical protein Kow0029_20070 [Candidatus Rifleibacteriota bacterium]
MKIKLIAYLMAATLVFTILCVKAALGSRVVDLCVRSENNTTILKIFLNGKIEPILRLNDRDNSLKLDFPGFNIGQNLLERPFSSDHIRIGYFFRLPGRESGAGLRVFLKNSFCKSVKRGRRSLELIIVGARDQKMVSHRSESLLHPSDGKFAPVHLSLSNAPALPVLQQLARSADLDIRFEQYVPENISVELDAANAKEAIKKIAEMQNAQFLEKDRCIWLTGSGRL